MYVYIRIGKARFKSSTWSDCCSLYFYLCMFYLSGLVPYDGVPREAWVTVHPAVVTLFMILAAAGIALAIACLIFNFYFRKSK